MFDKTLRITHRTEDDGSHTVGLLPRLPDSVQLSETSDKGPEHAMASLMNAYGVGKLANECEFLFPNLVTEIFDIVCPPADGQHREYSKGVARETAKTVERQVQDGWADALHVYVRAKWLEAAAKEIVDRLKGPALSAAHVLSADQRTQLGAEVKVATRTDWDYSHNPEWAALQGRMDEIRQRHQAEFERIAARDAETVRELEEHMARIQFEMQRAADIPRELGDAETGEIVYAAKRSQTNTISVTLPK